MFKTRFFAVMFLMLVFVFACNTGEDSVDNEKVTSIDTSMATDAPSIDEAYPLTLTDLLGRQITINEEPTRIIGISPTAMEMLYKVGGKAVGRDSGSKWEPSVEALPSVGGAYNPNIEAIVELAPDLIVIEALTQGHMADMLASTRAPIVAVRAASVKDVKDSLILLGKAIDKEDKAQEVAAEMQDRINVAVTGFDESRNLLILISDADRNLYAALPNSYAGAIVEALNLSNVASDLSESGPYPGYALFSSEQAIKTNPDVILTISPAPEPAPRLSTMLPRIPGYAGLDAVANGRVSEVSVDLFLQAPGPRIVDAIEELAMIIGDMEFE